MVFGGRKDVLHEIDFLLGVLQCDGEESGFAIGVRNAIEFEWNATKRAGLGTHRTKYSQISVSLVVELWHNGENMV